MDASVVLKTRIIVDQICFSEDKRTPIHIDLSNFELMEIEVYPACGMRFPDSDLFLSEGLAQEESLSVYSKQLAPPEKVPEKLTTTGGHKARPYGCSAASPQKIVIAPQVRTV